MTTKQEGLIDKVLSMWSDGKSGTEIALATNITRGAVQGHLHRARQNNDARAKLRGKMSKHLHLAMTRAVQPALPKPEPLESQEVLKTTQERKPPSRPKGPASPPPQARFLEHLSRNSCRYCYSDQAPYLLCAEPTRAGSSWCDEHRLIVLRFVKPKPIKLRKLAL